ncbi:MAG: DUF5118 domain-containing protein, partial [Gemmatimonadota bacterium]|nr:DUF5118 domain-containing protein [Gemmatimonadota bacterium]
MTQPLHLTLAASALLAGCAHAPPPAPAPAPVRSAAGAEMATTPRDSTGRPPASGEARPRPYSRVITPEAKTRRGMFAVHRVGDKLYFEIPARELNKDMLLVGRFARAAAADPNSPTGGFGEYGGDQFGEHTLNWER